MKIKSVLGAIVLLSVTISGNAHSSKLFSDRNNKNTITVYQTCGDIKKAKKDYTKVLATVSDAIMDAPLRYGNDKMTIWDAFIPYNVFLRDPDLGKRRLWLIEEFLVNSCDGIKDDYHLWRLLPRNFFDLETGYDR